MKNARLISALCCATMLCALVACGTGTEQGPVQSTPQTVSFFAMDTVMQLTAYGDSAASGLAKAQTAIEQIENLVSVTKEDSDIFRVNSNPNTPVAVSGITADLLETALSLCARTGGAMDISVYPVVRAWGFTTGTYRVPSDEELAQLVSFVGYTAIDYDATSKTIRVPGTMQLDLGAIAKGYSGDRAIGEMRSAGVTSALISLGGNVQSLGAKPDGSPWRVAVQNPENNESYAGVVSIENKAVITSGGYERYFEQDDEIYWHIMDPSTGRPAKNGLISVTVVGESGALCDSLSTSLFVMGLDGASEHWREYGDFDAVFITDNHELYITEGLEGSFAPLGDYEYTEVGIIRK